MIYPDFFPSVFSKSEQKLNESLLSRFGVEVQMYSGGWMRMIIDRSAETQANEKCYCLAWAPSSAFINRPPRIGDTVVLNPGGLPDSGEVLLEIARLLPCEEGSIKMALVISPKPR